MNQRPPLLFYCQHALGMGHLVRSLALASGLSELFRVVLLNGGAIPRGLAFPVGIARIDLPPLGFDSEMLLVSRDGRRTLQRAEYLRKKIILKAFRDLQPEVVLIELFPFGRKKFKRELESLLGACADRPNPPVLACSLRDILVGRNAQTRDDTAVEVANRCFDAIIVHSDPSFARLEESFHPQTALRVPVYYSGMVSAIPQNKTKSARGQKLRIIVSAGGGMVGEPLLRTAIDAWGLLQRTDEVEMKIIAGPFIPVEAWRRLRLLAKGKKGLTLRRFVPDLNAEMRRASASVSQCGYNTAMDIVSSGVSALVVPFGEGKEDEQMNRARRLERQGALRVLEPHKLSPERLAAEIPVLLEFKPHSPMLDLAGAKNSARILSELVAKRRGESAHAACITARVQEEALP